MSEVKKPEIVELPKKEAELENENILKLSKVYKFEDTTIGEIDMSGMENLTADDMIKANRVLSSSGNVSVLQETSLEYAITIAASATGLPIEFFKGLCPKDAIKVKNKVTSFFFGEE